jgi:hypothetical protein
MPAEIASAIREYASRTYVRRAKQEHLSRFTIRSGEVHSGMGFRKNRVPAVCSALRGKKFLEENGLRVVAENGPPSGMSTTVEITYEFVQTPGKKGGAGDAPSDPWLAVRGLLQDVFRDLGGGEDFIRRERQAWSENSGREHK